MGLPVGLLFFPVIKEFSSILEGDLLEGSI